MTAIDIASQSKRLGAEDVTIVYRRGAERMGASDYERELAQTDGVRIKLQRHAQAAGVVRRTASSRVEFEYTAETRRPARRHRRDLPARGRHGVQGDRPDVRRRTRSTAADGAHRARRRPHQGRRASAAPRSPGVWAGGDCIAGGEDLTVVAVEDGKVAAEIDPPGAHGPGLKGDVKWPIFAPNSSASSRRTRSGWPRRRRPTRKYNVVRAFKAGWGGVVWKTLGEDPPIVNVAGPRYGAIHAGDRRLIGLNNIELITDRAARGQPRRRSSGSSATGRTAALVVSLMVPCEEPNWKAILKRSRTPAATASSSISAARTA